jgi:serine/threonine protein kinase
VEVVNIKENLRVMNSQYSNNFIELSKIGEGGFGEIYKVYNNIDAQQYAIKKIPFFESNEADNMRAFNEVRCLAELNHENIVRYHTTWLELSDMSNEFIEDSKFQIYPTLYIQMELCECSLRDYLVKRNYSGKKVDMIFEKKCITGIINGVKYIHSKNILHRDINPNNIFLDKFMIPKIGDFGLSMKVGSESQETYMSSELGVKLYIPPEYEKEGIYTKKSDVYSLGIVIFEILQIFSTDVERIEIISKLRTNQYISNTFMEECLIYLEYINKMTDENMDSRITIEEIDL